MTTRGSSYLLFAFGALVDEGQAGLLQLLVAEQAAEARRGAIHVAEFQQRYQSHLRKYHLSTASQWLPYDSTISDNICQL